MLMGLTDSMYEGTYLWTDQSSVDYTNFTVTTFMDLTQNVCISMELVVNG